MNTKTKLNKNQWKTKDGHILLISEMDNRHLLNVFSLLERKGFISPETLSFYICGPQPSGDMATLCYEQELDRILDAPISARMGVMEKEIEKRDLNKI